MKALTPIHLAIVVFTALAVAYFVSTIAQIPVEWAERIQPLAPVLVAFSLGLIVAEKWLDRRGA